MFGFIGFGTAGPVSQPPVCMIQALGPACIGYGGRLGTEIVVELSC